MGAGSAKGLRKSASADDADNLSSHSDDEWVETDKLDEGTSIKPLNEGHRSKSFDFPSTFSKENELKVTRNENEEDAGGGDQNSNATKKGGRKIWNFFSDKNDTNEDEVNSESESESNRENNKETKTKKFRLFGKKNKEVKDEKLDSDINDLEKTFESLGIVGKSVWEQDIKPKQQSKDDLDTLEPMRNRLNVRMARPPRGINGLTVTNERRLDSNGSDINSTSSSKKKFNFSWDTEDDNKSLEIDEWDYRAVGELVACNCLLACYCRHLQIVIFTQKLMVVLLPGSIPVDGRNSYRYGGFKNRLISVENDMKMFVYTHISRPAYRDHKSIDVVVNITSDSLPQIKIDGFDPNKFKKANDEVSVSVSLGMLWSRHIDY